MADIDLNNPPVGEGHTKRERALWALEAFKVYQTVSGISRQLGIPKTTIRRWRDLAKSMGETGVVMPEFQDPEMPVNELLDHMERRFKTRKAAYESRNWFTIDMPTNDPVGICWFGDPHLDDPGHNIVRLRRDARTCKDTPGLYGANIGDTTNNWIGRLVRLYEDQEVTRTQARQLIQWFLTGAGIDWLLWIEGNHDAWRSTEALKLQCRNVVPLMDWRARFKVRFPNGTEVRFDAAHDHKGHSMYHNLHGQIKAALMDGQADIYVAGHKHVWGYYTSEMPQSGRVIHCLRVRGYKTMDHYCTTHGFEEQAHGAAAVTILNPQAKDATRRIIVSHDVQEAAGYLRFLRQPCVS